MDKEKIKVCFVCLGNICRSPMAELVFADKTEKRGIADRFEISSRGTSDEEEGNRIYPPAAAELARHGIGGTHIAQRLTAAEVEASDYVLVMDGKNLRDSYLITNGRFADKISKLGAYSGAGDIIDPWYSRDFSRTYAEIDAACDAFLSALERNGRI
ncbi:MAG: low molecular weight phosphotyrosine protein phosphatase [Clostridia bacterium]|nr:low molecular weight phosphotyrosine protein phosphatase [Clostridia bacterium]